MSASYPTPVYWHAGRGGFREVYEPAEDSFLLVDAQEKDTDRLQLMTSGTPMCVSGEGQWLRSAVSFSGISGWTFSSLSLCVCVSFDQCVLFFQVGREVTNRLLPVVAQLLSSEGLFYLITIAENDPGDLILNQGLVGDDLSQVDRTLVRGHTGHGFNHPDRHF
uniref:Uncharacterized protein n=1 Tax=Sander lucioperca TaxID=283035 RepID=A0A8D0AS71_SANLU